MSILSALSEKRHDNKNLAELAKLPQALIMQMGQRKELSQEEIAMIISKKAEMIESAARQKALSEVAGGQMPSVIEQKMATIAQAENPMPQQMAQAPQLPEDVGIAQNPVPPMQMAGGGIIAFDEGGDVDIDPEDEYQDLLDQAQEDETNQNIFDLISEMGNNVVSNAGAGITTGTGFQSFSAPDNKNAEFGIKAGRGEDKGDLIGRLRAEIMQRESGGRRYDKEGNLLTSSKGALGEMQVMPATARDPGFGIKPARDVNDPNELSRVGREYVGALLNKYQDPKLTMIAYNMGPTRTDAWLAAGADIRKLPKETQGYIRGVSLASGGEVKHYDIGGEIDTAGAELDALRSGTDSLYQELMRGGSRGGAKTPELQAAYENALALRKQKEAEYQALMAKGGVDKPAFFPQSSLSTKRPEANPIVKRESVKAETTSKDNKTNVTPPGIPDELKNAQIAPLQNKPPAVETPRAEAEKETFNLMKYIQERQARADKAAELDKWQAGLAAGLGMLGGTSQYWQENVGKGGQLGVQQLAQLQKLRASQDIASDKMLGTAYNAETLGKLRRDQVAQSNSVKYANALSNVKENRLKIEDKYLARPEYMDLSQLSIYRDRLQKNPNDKETRAKYASLLAKKQALENKIKKEYPDPDPTLYGIKGDPNKPIKLV
jgi:hypothetical protein